jgi:signal transduction histidine kinase
MYRSLKIIRNFSRGIHAGRSSPGVHTRLPSLVVSSEKTKELPAMNANRSLLAKATKAGIVSRCVIALLLPAVALWLSLVFEVSFGNPFWFFFPCVVIASTWFCGKFPGWMTTIISMIAVQYYFIPPLRSFEIRRQDVPFSLTFLGCQIFATWLVTKRKQTEDSLRQANAALVTQMAERELAEESLRKTRAELARVVRITTVGELTACIAHEVNQPLGAVVTNCDACSAWLASESPNLLEAQAAAERAAAGATRASEVIGRIRSLIKNAPIERIPVQLNDVITEIVGLAAHQAVSGGISMSTELEPNLPPVLGDKIQFQQVILNLVTNGLEATSGVNGRPRRLEIRTQMRSPDQVQVSVCDTGVGVAHELLPRLFEPFFTTHSHGIGMGLPISRSIIEAHGGRLWAESSLGEGSVFQFTVPLGASLPA